jgi:hypothetical protein
MMDTESG